MISMVDKSSPNSKILEVFAYTDIYWDSLSQGPKLFSQHLDLEMKDLKPVLKKYFNDKGEFII